MSQRAEIKASVAGLLEASVLYLAMIDDNERSKDCILCPYWFLLITSQSWVCEWVWVMEFWVPLLYLASVLFYHLNTESSMRYTEMPKRGRSYI